MSPASMAAGADGPMQVIRLLNNAAGCCIYPTRRDADRIVDKVIGLSFMQIESSQGELRATVPCKVNLFLEVLGKRSDGYHELDTVMLALSLCDDLTYRPDLSGDFRLAVTFEEGESLEASDPAWNVPADGRNLVIRAMEMLRNRLGRLPRLGGDIHLHKRIPSMAGLGGGSADAAAALLLTLLAHELPTEDMSGGWELMLDCAGKLGSDVNFFLEGANTDDYWVARCQGRGERVEPLSGDLHDWSFVVVHPPAGCGTAEVFSKVRVVAGERRSPERLIESLRCNDARQAGKELYNALEYPAEQVTDWISRAGRWIDRYDQFGQALSGSGSARFCLCRSGEQAERVVRELKSQGTVRAYAVRPWCQPHPKGFTQIAAGRSP
ncbi:4-(cytidine 5'-diphospho)-2-C-methyl-D-erythritol kinase [Pirellulaceae bacterium SH501]